MGHAEDLIVSIFNGKVEGDVNDGRDE